jgi:hypothetical protein
MNYFSPFSVLPFPVSHSPLREKGYQLTTDNKKKEELITSSPLSMNN